MRQPTPIRRTSRILISPRPRSRELAVMAAIGMPHWAEASARSGLSALARSPPVTTAPAMVAMAHFSGAMVHAPVAVYSPINIAVAGYNSSAHADQTNHVVFDQSAFQMAGVGGDGGNGNAAIGGNVSVSGTGHGPHQTIGGAGLASTTAGLAPCDRKRGNHAGNGGDGYFYGGIVHATFAFYYPINIAVAGYNSSADADQTNNVVFDQSAFQMAGVGGDGGNGNAATGGDARTSSLPSSA